MFITILWIGTILGVLAGLTHAIDIHRMQTARQEPGGTAMALYRGLWAVVLWTLFGGYLLVLWIIGLVLRPLLGVILRRRRIA